MADRLIRVTIASQVNSFVQGMEQATRAAEKAKKGSEDATAAYERQKQAMNQVGISLMAAGTVAVAATALAVRAAVDWESAWAGVTKTVDGNAEQMAELEGDLRTLAKTLPATHREIAAVAEAAGQLGVERESVAAFTRTMIDLAETTNLTADEAATSIAQFMNIMQTAPDDVDNLGASLVALGNDGASTERDIIQMAQRIAGSGRIIGLTEGQVLGFANALASVGIEAEAGGSAISRIMTDIAVAVSSGGDELETFAQVAGMSSRQFQKAFKDDPADAIATFIEGLARVNAEGGDVFATLSALGQTDVRVSRALLGMANSGDLLRKSLELGNVAWAENTALATEAQKRYETTEAKLQVMANRVHDAAIEFGDVFLPVVSAVAEAVGGLADTFGSMPDGVQTLIAWLTAVGGAAAVAAGAFLLGVPKIAEFRIALGVLAQSSIPAVATAAVGAQAAVGKMTTGLGAAARFLTGPWGLALAAAAVGVLALQQALDNLRASSEEMQNSLTTATSGQDILSTAAKGMEWTYWRDVTADMEDMSLALTTLEERHNNWLLNLQDVGKTSTAYAGVRDLLNEVGKELGKLAETDAPAAARAFRLMAEDQKLSEHETMLLLKRMPEYQDALMKVATQMGVNIDTTDDNVKVQQLLNIVMAEAEPPATEAADAYKAAADEAADLTSEIKSLIDAVNEANGVGQDAVTTNARYQESLAGITEEVQRQKDEYEKANGSLSGFNLSLDQNTASGSKNAAMLADVARNAQTAAAAQFEQDSATMSAKDATDKYVATLAEQRRKFEEAAVAAGYNKDEVKALADQVFKLPSKKEIEILVDTASALSAADRLVWQISQKRATIYVDGKPGNVVRPGQVAGFAGGGSIPGTPSLKDNVLIHAASGEFVVRTQQATIPANRAALEYMNRGGVIRGYANGGVVQPQYAQSPGFVARGGYADLDGLANRIVQALFARPTVTQNYPVHTDPVQGVLDAQQLAGVGV